MIYTDKGRWLSNILIIFLVILSISNYSCSSQEDKIAKEFTLKGEISDQDSGILVLSYWRDKERISDTAIIRKGRFHFAGEIIEPTPALLTGKNVSDRVYIYIEPGKMKIKLSIAEFNSPAMKGSETQHDFDMLRTLENPFRERISEVINRRNNLTDSLDRSVCDTINKILKREIEELDRLWSSLQKKIDSIQVTFVLENPHTFSSVICLRDLQGNEIIPPDSVKNMFSRLDNSLRNSTYGKYIHEDIRKNENMRIGSQAPEFKATDINQQTVTLSQFKGKSVVLLDFWASWCVPCRKTIPHLKTVFNKYHPLGLEIVAVSTDLNRSQWIAAIKEDRTDLWYHIPVAEKYSEGVFSSFDIYQNYFISSIPTTILVDRDGYIIGQIKGYSKRNEEILDSLLTSLFGN